MIFPRDEHSTQVVPLPPAPEDGTPPPYEAASWNADVPQVGRYVLLEFIGAGGMGVVHRAYDPKLQREVAIKRLKPSSLDRGQSARLLREARAMATISHPNVISIYDVGIDDGFFAMEYVDGLNLSEWLRLKTRSRAEIVEMFILAGRGLEAAHQHGLVHRDFKPSNVMVGADGQVRVMDFGLVRYGSEPASVLPSASHAASPAPPARRDSLTSAGYILGTPVFMPPEALRGEAATAQSDQYSFCVSLQMALGGGEPMDPTYTGTQGSEVGSGTRLTTGRTKGLRRVARRVDDVLARGLSDIPEERWADMGALLKALEPKRTRVSWALGLGGAAAVASVAAIAMPLLADTPPDPCSEIAEMLTGVWDEERRTQLASAFGSVERTFAQDSLVAVETRLDAFSRDWLDSQEQTCQASKHVRVPTAHIQQQELCLRRQLQVASALIDEFVGANPELVQIAVQAVGRLPSPAACQLPDPLQGFIDIPAPEIAADVELVEDQLLATSVLIYSGQWERVGESAASALEAAERTGFHPVIARAHLDVAKLKVRKSEYKQAEDSLRSALHESSAAGDLRSQVSALRGLCVLYSRHYEQDERGDALCKQAAALLEKLEYPAELTAQVRLSTSRIHARTRNNIAELSSILEFIQDNLPAGHRLQPSAMASLLNAHSRVGAFSESLVVSREMTTWVEKNLGTHHPDYVHALGSQANALFELGRTDEALAVYERALALSKNAGNLAMPYVAEIYKNLGQVRMAEGNPELALEESIYALEILRRIYPNGHGGTAMAAHRTASILLLLDRPEEALQHSEEALSLWRAVSGPDSPDSVLFGLQYKLHAQLRLSHPIDPTELERALDTLGAGTGIEPVAHAEFEFIAGWIFEERFADRTRARELIVSALQHLESTDIVSPVQLAEMRDWLTEHPATAGSGKR